MDILNPFPRNLMWLVGFSVCTVLMSSATDVVTYHNDIARTGQNRQETYPDPRQRQIVALREVVHLSAWTE